MKRQRQKGKGYTKAKRNKLTTIPEIPENQSTCDKFFRVSSS